MRTPNLGSIGYAAGIPSGDLNAFLVTELQKIAAAINALAAGHLDVAHVVPDKPREGDLRLADGTDWNPGSGAGLYRYTSGAWVFVG